MTDQEYTAEAQRHLRDLMENQRQQRAEILEQAFAQNEVPRSHGDSGAISGAEGEADIESAKESALAYANARNNGARIRQYNQDTEPQRQGVASALAWLQRKRKSAIKK